MNIAVLGDGMLGSEIVKQTRWDYYSRKKDGVDILDIQTWSQLLLPYDVIINCIAHTKTYDKDRSANWKVNYEFVSKLVDYCELHSKKIVHISTDYIYSNSKKEVTEEDVPVHCENWYSYTKLLGDGYVQLKSKNYLICRESHKPYPFPYKSAWIDQFTTGDYVNIIADLIIKLIRKNASGVYNVGTNLKTWYHHTKDEFNTLIGFRGDEVPADISMNIEKMKNFLNDNI
jgi:dTDP-4-dehydrorhamnose reductase